MRLSPVILQSLFIEGEVDNSGGGNYQDWLETVERIHPKEVYVYTVDQPPADSRVKAVSVGRLIEIKEEIEEKLGIRAFAYDKKHIFANH